MAGLRIRTKPQAGVSSLSTVPRKHKPSPPPLLIARGQVSQPRFIQTLSRRFILTVMAVSLATPFASAQAPHPSFDCSRVKSAVNKMICASPELSALDNKLANDFNNARHQAGMNGKALQADENHWLAAVRNQCTTSDCVQHTYQTRDAEILRNSERAASPAAYDETHPFLADAQLLEKARRNTGKPCDGPSDVPGFPLATGALPIILHDGIIRTLADGNARFASLIAHSEANPPNCTIEDVAALPDAAQHATYLQCTMPGYDLSGLGIRLPGHREVAGFWTIDRGKLKRQPVGVLGGDISCQQPETGE